MDGDQLEVSATLEDADAVDRLIAILQANKALLPAKN
jgi:Tfp pilus assembly protein PilN